MKRGREKSELAKRNVISGKSRGEGGRKRGGGGGPKTGRRALVALVGKKKVSTREKEIKRTVWAGSGWKKVENSDIQLRKKREESDGVCVGS